VKPVVLVDLSGCFWRDYYGTGSDVEAYRTTIDRIDRFRKDHRTAVCCEGKNPIRFSWFPDYKATRKEKPEDAKAALKSIREQLETWEGVPVISCETFEADDTIATLAHQAWMDDVLIISSDKDLAALITENVKMQTSAGIMGIKECIEKFGVRPDQIRDWLALVGDAADNIPGCPNTGPGRARDLLQRFDTLDAVLAAARADVPEKENEVLKVRGVGKKTLDSLKEWDPSLAIRLVTLLDNAPIELERLWPFAA
jgi:DNA polymerase I